jgi:quinol monooxygenase YgiN
MLISTVKIYPLHEKRQEVLETLQSVMGPAQALPGCLSCSLSEEVGGLRGILYIEQWRSLPEMELHVNSSNYGRILGAMELSSQIPEVCFYELGTSWNLELVERVRNQK